jgi:hypothetical protein
MTDSNTISASIRRLALVVLCIGCLQYREVHAQQVVDTLQTSTFQLVLNRHTIGQEYSTAIRECSYLPTNRSFIMDVRETIIARIDTSWAYPYEYSL